MEGLLTCPANPNGIALFTLPAAARPPTIRKFPVYALVTSTPTPMAVDVSSTGAVTFDGSNSTVQVGLDGIAFATISGVVGGSL